VADADTCDFAVVGSSPLAYLLAGLLVRDHGRRVFLVAGPWSPFLLSRRFDLSIFPATRPETLALVEASGAETLQLLTSLGKGLIRRIDPIFVGETAETAAALGHFMHLARAMGLMAEPAADRAQPDATLLRLRDVALLVPDAFMTATAHWLAAAKVNRADASTAGLVIRRDGSSQVTTGDLTIEAAQTILADDEAILRHLTLSAGRLLRPRAAAAVLTEPANSPRATFTAWLDRSVSVLQRGPAGVAAIVLGDPSSVHERLGSCLRPPNSLPRAGETRFTTVATADGAPFFGLLPGGRAIGLAGFGPTGAFLAPAIARAIVGASTAPEQAWFEAHGPARGVHRPATADYEAFAA
jgi:hypothetical protein